MHVNIRCCENFGMTTLVEDIKIYLTDKKRKAWEIKTTKTREFYGVNVRTI